MPSIGVLARDWQAEEWAVGWERLGGRMTGGWSLGWGQDTQRLIVVGDTRK